MPEGFESSSTNIASDHGVGNARRSIAITCGRSAYLRRRIFSESLISGAWRLVLEDSPGGRLRPALPPRLRPVGTHGGLGPRAPERLRCRCHPPPASPEIVATRLRQPAG